MNDYMIFILFILAATYLLNLASTILNLNALVPNIPSEFEGLYDKEKYSKSQNYTKIQSQFGIITSTLDSVIMCLVILLGGFNVLDQWLQEITLSPILRGLLFYGSLFLLNEIISVPFSLYYTFVIEERFGFNKQTIKTYLSDKLKSYVLTAILGSLILSCLLYFFKTFEETAWLYAWGLIVFFIIIGQPLYLWVIAPLFNKFTPLPEGELRSAIEDYATKNNFSLGNIFVVDNSKRSTKSNAYFGGFGKSKKIVLFDTLIKQHTVDELVAILAHEMGHYQKKHILIQTGFAILQTGFLMYVMSFFLNSKELFNAFKMEHMSVYAGLLFFMILYTPFDLVLSCIGNYFSRKFEFQADQFAKETTGSADHLILGLKKLSVHNLGNLMPHPLNVILHHSHPPVLDRIKKLHPKDEC